MEHTWAEGNTNKAVRNLYSSLDSKKLAIILQVVSTFSSDSEDLVGDLDNNIGIHLYGYLIDYERAEDCENIEKWKNYEQNVKHKSPYLTRTPSFESLILYLLQLDLITLKKLLKKRKECQTNSKACWESMAPKPKKSKCMQGGSDTNSIVEDFIDIKVENTKEVVEILKMFDRLDGEFPYTDNDNEVVDKLTTELPKFFILEPKVFRYSPRVIAGDVWKITMFLFKRPKEELKGFMNKFKLIKQAEIRYQKLSYDEKMDPKNYAILQDPYNLTYKSSNVYKNVSTNGSRNSSRNVSKK
jgi:hypothetical protein